MSVSVLNPKIADCRGNKRKRLSHVICWSQLICSWNRLTSLILCCVAFVDTGKSWSSDPVLLQLHWTFWLTYLIALRDPLDSRPIIDEWVYATGEKEDNKTLARDKREGAITCVFCRDLHLTFMFSSRLQDCEDPLFTERWSLAESIFKQNYCQACQACHTRFAVVLPLLSCCANSLFKMKRDIPPGYSATSPLFS